MHRRSAALQMGDRFRIHFYRLNKYADLEHDVPAAEGGPFDEEETVCGSIAT